jgi:hypothetical protein
MLVADHLARAALPAYTSKFSRHDFTLPQLFACLCCKALLKRSYREAETVVSMIKRNLGSALAGRTAASRKCDMLLKVLTHDVMIIRRQRRVETEQDVPIIPPDGARMNTDWQAGRPSRRPAEQRDRRPTGGAGGVRGGEG